MIDPANLALVAATPPGVIRLVGVLYTERPTGPGAYDPNFHRLFLTPGLTEWVEFAQADAVDSDREGLGAGIGALGLTSLEATTVWVKGNARLTYSRTETFTFGAEFLDGDILALLRRQRRLLVATTLGGLDELDVTDPLLGNTDLPTSTRTASC